MPNRYCIFLKSLGFLYIQGKIIYNIRMAGIYQRNTGMCRCGKKKPKKVVFWNKTVISNFEVIIESIKNVRNNTK